MSLILVGTNHKYSLIDIRGKIAFSKKRLKDALIFLKNQDICKGAVILSTCNRVEIYTSAGSEEEIKYFISRYHEIDIRQISPYLYIYEGKEVKKHLSLVAAGLDSLILGETQILGQVKFALAESESIGFADEVLRDMFYSAIAFAKKVHTETQVFKGKVSLGSVAVDFIKEKVGALSGKKILIIGIGKVTESVLRYLKKERSDIVFISNRTYEKARALAEKIGAEAVRFNELNKFLQEADIVITATGSPHYIIKKDRLEGGHKLFIVDLAVPRDVDPSVKEIGSVELYTLEDLDSVIQKNLDKRIREAKKAEKLWKEHIESELDPALLP